MALGIAGFIMSQPKVPCGLDPAQLSFNAYAPSAITSPSIQSPSSDKGIINGDLAELLKLQEQLKPIKNFSERMISHAREVRKSCEEYNRAITEVFSRSGLDNYRNVDDGDIKKAKVKILENIKEIEENRELTKISLSLLRQFGAIGEFLYGLSKATENRTDTIQKEYNKTVTSAADYISKSNYEIHAAYREQFNLLLNMKAALSFLSIDSQPNPVLSPDGMDSFLTDIWG